MTHVDLPRSSDLLFRIREHLLPLSQPSDGARNGEEHSEYLGLEAHGYFIKRKLYPESSRESGSLSFAATPQLLNSLLVTCYTASLYVIDLKSAHSSGEAHPFVTMSDWPRYPTLYEINTWVWLSELSRKTGISVDLSSVPSSEWDDIAKYGFDAVWFMGVWERSSAGIAIANRNGNLLNDFRRALPDFKPGDNVGSPYCIRRYVVDKHLGGPPGLATARRELARRGMKLLLDLVPNHVAPDHPWVTEHPEYFIRGNSDDVKNDPASYMEVQGSVCACGRDPYFPAWSDVLQLNAFQPGLRQAVIETLSSIATQCDGVRCDMAMLLLNQIFERTWGARAEQRPPTEYWGDVIPAIKRVHPNFRFIAEAYWDLEWELQQQGFDFCYDKRLYDRLEHEQTRECSASSMR